MRDMHRGDVWWADVPGDKRRPVVILTRERFVDRLNSLLVAPVTTRIRDIPTEVVVGPDHGLPQRSAVNLDNVFTLDRRRFDQLAGRLDAERLDELCVAYRFAAGC